MLLQAQGRLASGHDADAAWSRNRLAPACGWWRGRLAFSRAQRRSSPRDTSWKIPSYRTRSGRPGAPVWSGGAPFRIWTLGTHHPRQPGQMISWSGTADPGAGRRRRGGHGRPPSLSVRDPAECRLWGLNQVAAT